MVNGGEMGIFEGTTLEQFPGTPCQQMIALRYDECLELSAVMELAVSCFSDIRTLMSAMKDDVVMRCGSC